MFLDNSILTTPNPHIAELDPLSFTSRGPGANSPLFDTVPKPPPFTMFSAQPVAFPPDDVPLEYVRHKLQREAQDFWGNIETSDCTITIPLPPLGSFNHYHASSGSNRRATQPVLGDWPRLVLHLHSIFLLSSSSFLRGLLSGALPLDLIHTAQQTGQGDASHLFSGQFAHPVNHIPRLLPCSPDHPSIYLPVPDPQSIQAIIYWIYWGVTDYIEECLRDGSIQWEGLCKNADYLGLPTELKIFLAQWRHLCVSPDRSPNTSDGESDADFSDSDEDTLSTTSDSETSWDLDGEKEELVRGRSTMTRPLYFRDGSLCRT